MNEAEKKKYEAESQLYKLVDEAESRGIELYKAQFAEAQKFAEDNGIEFYASGLIIGYEEGGWYTSTAC